MGWVLPNPKSNPKGYGLGWIIKMRTQPNGVWVGLGYRWVTQQKRVLIYGHPIRYLESSLHSQIFS